METTQLAPKTYEQRRVEEIATAKQKNAELDSLTREIAKILGGWEVFPITKDLCKGYIVSPEGARVYINYEQYQRYDRIVVSGYLHIGPNQEYVEVYDDNGNRTHPPSITVAVSRGAAVIAREIQRRFLPEYLRIYSLALQKLAATKCYEDATRANLLALLPLIGKNDSALRGKKDSQVNFYVEGKAWGHVAASSDSVSLEINSVNLETAKLVLRVLGITKEARLSKLLAEADRALDEERCFSNDEEHDALYALVQYLTED